MKYLPILLTLICGCMSAEMEHYAQALGADTGVDADMGMGPTPSEVFEAACNDNSDPNRWQLVVEVTEDLYPSAPIVCDTRAVIIRGNGHTVHGSLSFPSQAANWSTVENLRFVGDDYYAGTEVEHIPYTADESIGVNVQAHGIRLKNVRVEKFDIGVRVWGTYSNGTNANNTIFNQGQLYNNGIGLFIDGGDSQAGRFSDLETRNNTVHVWDSSFLGNIHIGGVSDGYGVYRRHDSAAAYSTLLGVYIEGDPPTNNAFDMIGYNLVLGGSLSIWSTSSIWGIQSTVNPHGFSRLGFSSHNRDMRVTVPAGDHAAFTYAHRDEDFWAWHAFRYFDVGKSWWLTAYLNSGYHYPLYWGGKYSNSYVGDVTLRDWTGARLIPSGDIEVTP